MHFTALIYMGTFPCCFVFYYLIWFLSFAFYYYCSFLSFSDNMDFASAVPDKHSQSG